MTRAEGSEGRVHSETLKFPERRLLSKDKGGSGWRPHHRGPYVRNDVLFQRQVQGFGEKWYEVICPLGKSFG